MPELISKKAFEAIKKDDAAAFAELKKNDRIGAYRYGRFPALSLMYLYNSKKLLKAYEEELLKISDYTAADEPVAAFTEFKKRAGKCLRLYFGEVVSPLEMLLISDKTRRLKRVYPLTKPTQGVKQRLQSIYFIKYGLSVKFENDKIILDRRPLKRSEKKKIATICLSAFLIAAVCVGVPTATVKLIPEPVEGEVTKLSQIDFASKKEYTLKSDITLPENYSVEKVNCRIDGGGRKLTFKSGATLGTLNGSVSNLNVETTGDKPMFATLSETAKIEDVTVSVNADFVSEESLAFVAGVNVGTVKNVTLNVSGKLSAAAADGAEVSSLTFGGIVQNNSYKNNTVTQTTYRGIIDDCTINYENFTLEGQATANAAFGGVAGLNYGYVRSCTVSGGVTADTFDVAGVCVENYGLLSGDKNSASLYQTTRDTGWNSITCGIVLNNANIVENCENRGEIVSKSECGQFEETENETAVSASGIAYLSRGSSSNLIISGCKNYGSVTASAEYRSVYAAGVCVSNNSGIYACGNYGNISATAKNGNAIYAGGISSLAYGYVVKTVNEGNVISEGDGVTYAGGIASLSVAQLMYCRTSGEVSARGDNVCAGGILGYGENLKETYLWQVTVYSANIESCISESRVKAEKTGERAAYSGGIAGYLKEESYDNNGNVIYFSGKITGSYFTGSVQADGYCGNIAGGVGINIYNSNSYTASGVEYPYFDKNFSLEGLQSKAFGTAFSADGSFTEVEDKGVTSANTDAITSDENYKKILAEINGEEN